MSQPSRLALLKEIAEFLNEETEMYSMMNGALHYLLKGSQLLLVGFSLLMTVDIMNWLLIRIYLVLYSVSSVNLCMKVHVGVYVHIIIIN